jgi:hypothetical protein
MKKQVKRENWYLKGRKGFKKTKFPLDEGYQISHKDGSRTHRHTGDDFVHVDKSDPNKNWIGHIINDIISRGKGAPVQNYWIVRIRKIKGKCRKVLVRKTKDGKEKIKILK